MISHASNKIAQPGVLSPPQADWSNIRQLMLVATSLNKDNSQIGDKTVSVSGKSVGTVLFIEKCCLFSLIILVFLSLLKIILSTISVWFEAIF
jgi:hypothetical protein